MTHSIPISSPVQTRSHTFPKPPATEQVLMVFLVGHLLPKGPTGWDFARGGEIEIKAVPVDEPYGDDWELTIFTQSLLMSPACSVLVLRDGKWERP